MRKTIAVVLALVLCCAVTGAPAEKTEVVVFAAASLTEALTEIGSLYEAANPEVRLVFSFDSSGTLKTQIREGAECDVFISAARKQMDQLDMDAEEEKNPERLDYLLPGSRIDLLENRVVLITAPGNAAGIRDFDGMAERLRNGEILMAMGNADVPVGQYTQKILAFYGLDEEELGRKGKITYGSNVKEVTTQVAEGCADCGVVYCTDAFSAGLEAADTATAEMCGQVIYPAAVMKNSKVPEAAEAFLDYLRGSEAAEVFERIGFSPVVTE